MVTTEKQNVSRWDIKSNPVMNIKEINVVTNIVDDMSPSEKDKARKFSETQISLLDKMSESLNEIADNTKKMYDQDTAIKKAAEKTKEKTIKTKVVEKINEKKEKTDWAGKLGNAIKNVLLGLGGLALGGVGIGILGLLMGGKIISGGLMLGEKALSAAFGMGKVALKTLKLWAHLPFKLAKGVIDLFKTKNFIEWSKGLVKAPLKAIKNAWDISKGAIKGGAKAIKDAVVSFFTTDIFKTGFAKKYPWMTRLGVAGLVAGGAYLFAKHVMGVKDEEWVKAGEVIGDWIKDSWIYKDIAQWWEDFSIKEVFGNAKRSTILFFRHLMNDPLGAITELTKDAFQTFLDTYKWKREKIKEIAIRVGDWLGDKFLKWGTDAPPLVGQVLSWIGKKLTGRSITDEMYGVKTKANMEMMQNEYKELVKEQFNKYRQDWYKKVQKERVDFIKKNSQKKNFQELLQQWEKEHGLMSYEEYEKGLSQKDRQALMKKTRAFKEQEKLDKMVKKETYLKKLENEKLDNRVTKTQKEEANKLKQKMLDTADSLYKKVLFGTASEKEQKMFSESVQKYFELTGDVYYPPTETAIDKAKTKINKYYNETLKPAAINAVKSTSKWIISHAGTGFRNFNQSLSSYLGGSGTSYIDVIVGIETGGKQDWNAVNSSSGAFGLFQFLPSTWNEFAPKVGVPKYNGTIPSPENQVKVFTKYIEDRINFLKRNKYPVNDWTIWVTHNLGPGNVGYILGMNKPHSSFVRAVNGNVSGTYSTPESAKAAYIAKFVPLVEKYGKSSDMTKEMIAQTKSTTLKAPTVNNVSSIRPKPKKGNVQVGGSLGGKQARDKVPGGYGVDSVQINQDVDMSGITSDTKLALQGLSQEWSSYGYGKIIIKSAYRDPVRNAAVGGAKNSMHLQGRAFDIDVSRWNKEARIEFIKLAGKYGFRGIGVGENTIHIDTRPYAASWQYINGSSASGVPAWAAEAVRTAHIAAGSKPSVRTAMTRGNALSITPVSKDKMFIKNFGFVNTNDGSIIDALKNQYTEIVNKVVGLEANVQGLQKDVEDNSKPTLSGSIDISNCVI